MVPCPHHSLAGLPLLAPSSCGLSQADGNCEVTPREHQFMGAGINPGWQSSGLLQCLGPESCPGRRERCKKQSKEGDDPAESSQKRSYQSPLPSPWAESMMQSQFAPVDPISESRKDPGRVSLPPERSVPISSHPNSVCAALGKGNGGRGLGAQHLP